MMKKTMLILLVMGFVISARTPAVAHEYDRGDSDNPVRIAAYLFHPLGIAVEYVVTRPIHWLVSRPTLNVWFGHDPTEKDGDYFKWYDPTDHFSDAASVSSVDDEDEA